MGQVPLKDSERIAALGCLGYSEREATFVCLAALHSGYFLRRQYRAFLAREDGSVVGQLIEKALARGHADVLTYHRKTQIYHLGARPFYTALGQTDNRNRRHHEPITIKGRLMALDFVLAHRDAYYLATEQEKLDYFRETRSVERAALPAKLYRSAQNGESTARYFVEKYPIFVAEPVGSVPPVVSFGFVDEGSVTLAGFETFLRQYRALFAALDRFAVVYITANRGRCQEARALFERGTNSRQCHVPDPYVRRLLDHFEARRLYDAKDLASFDRTKLIRLRNERQEFSSPDHDALYALWQRGGPSALLEKMQPKSDPAPQLSGTFSTWILEHSYDFFGHVNGY